MLAGAASAGFSLDRIHSAKNSGDAKASDGKQNQQTHALPQPDATPLSGGQ